MPRKVLTSKDAQNLTVDFEEQAIVKRELSPFRVLAELGCSELYQYAAKKVGSINPVCLKEMENGIPGNYKVIYYGVLTTFLVHATNDLESFRQQELKSVHFKNTVARSADFALISAQKDHNFEQTEDRATVFLK